ncbi:MAG: glycine cleavage system protein GcvH [Candidatus Omnitrophica bacterium]|nr:glycine cleavage system protein GcvH [Candidatus Omnitrophota bacterium]
MNIPQDLKYTKTHEWAKREGNIVIVGITEYAQKEISDVVFVETPKLGQQIERGKPAAVVESVKAAFDIYAPVSGKVSKVNQSLESAPGIINEECYGKGWFFEIDMSYDDDWNQLLSADQYSDHLKQESTKH